MIFGQAIEKQIKQETSTLLPSKLVPYTYAENLIKFKIQMKNVAQEGLTSDKKTLDINLAYPEFFLEGEVFIVDDDIGSHLLDELAAPLRARRAHHLGRPKPSGQLDGRQTKLKDKKEKIYIYIYIYIYITIYLHQRKCQTFSIFIIIITISNTLNRRKTKPAFKRADDL